MSRYGVAFRKVPNLTKDKYAGSTGNVWILAALMSRVEPLWSIIGSLPEYRTSQWHGWMLNYLTNHCFHDSNRRQAANDPFKLQLISSVDKFPF